MRSPDQTTRVPTARSMPQVCRARSPKRGGDRSKQLVVTCLVRRSARFKDVSTFTVQSRMFADHSCMPSARTSNTSPNAAVASQRAIGGGTCIPASRNSSHKAKASAPPASIAYNSASALLVAYTFCVRDQCRSTAPLTFRQAPDTLRRSGCPNHRLCADRCTCAEFEMAPTSTLHREYQQSIEQVWEDPFCVERWALEHAYTALQ